MDILNVTSPEQIVKLELPFVIDLVKAKIRLEENKSKAQKMARELNELSGRK
jgi:hypothetical protein